ncbi:MAG: hypothetical protein Q4C48_06460 [Lachnospiraceae bacterium]|nr:hypothetical protein [Lachnospiraceae bacterium]
MKNFIAILLAMLTLLNGGSNVIITEENIGDYLASDCASVAYFIIDNLSLFAEEYNRTLSEGETPFEGTSCEGILPVYVTTLEQEGLYLDFNDDNGYMIVLDDYSVVAFETTGDLDYLKELDYTYYGIYDGFLYRNEDDDYVPYEFTELTEEDWNEYLESELGKKQYDGQTSGTDGCIYDPDAFVKDKYGKGYSVYKENSLPDYEYVKQFNFSIYRELKDGKPLSEGNCSLSSVYSLLNYLKISGQYDKLPSSSSQTWYNATKDSFYSKYKKKKNYEIETPIRLPNLYLAVREYAIDTYGYEESGTNPFRIPKMIEEVGKKYGCKLKTKHILIWSYESQVVKEIDNGHPTIWNMANSSSYKSHSTVVTGYKTYRKTKKVLGFKLYSYVELLELNDNWETTAQYFDFTNYNAFGSFVRVR